MSEAQNIFDNAIMLADKVLKEYVASYHDKQTSELFDYTMDSTGWIEIEGNGKKFRLTLAFDSLSGNAYSEEYVNSHPDLVHISDMIKQHALIMLGTVELLYNNCLQRYMEEKHDIYNLFKKENYTLTFEGAKSSIVIDVVEII